MGDRPELLDLFCCAGGAGEGYHRAGFRVTGVDIVDRPRYPHRFVKADVPEMQEAMGITWTDVREELTESIPPAYTEWIGSAFLAGLAAAA
jgi:site-specific DNA-cytosine methylase